MPSCAGQRVVGLNRYVRGKNRARCRILRSEPFGKALPASDRRDADDGAPSTPSRLSGPHLRQFLPVSIWRKRATSHRLGREDRKNSKNVSNSATSSKRHRAALLNLSEPARTGCVAGEIDLLPSRSRGKFKQIILH